MGDYQTSHSVVIFIHLKWKIEQTKPFLINLTNRKVYVLFDIESN